VQQFIKDQAGNIIKDENGNALQPDVTIYYPDNRKIIADSKVSLVAWDRYVGSENPEEQKTFLAEHIRSLRAHIDGLSRKNYPRYAGALEYVLLFVPIEPAFLEALKTDRELWKYAYDKGIVLVSPTNLLAVLKIIADLWKVELQSRNAIEIAERAGALYDKFHGFVSQLETVGERINQSQTAYQEAFKLLSTGNGNLIRRVEDLKKMGAKANKQLGENLVKGARE
jgi:DNA recombination protein RmuC